MLEAMDLGTLYFFGGQHRPWLIQLAVAITTLGNPPVLIGVGVAGTLLLLWLRQPRLALLFAVVALSSWGLEWGAKWYVGRVRPDVLWRVIPLPDQPSFPSGHALCSLAIYGGLGLILAQLVRPRWGVVLGAAGIALGIAIGLTRPYLGVHYPYDVAVGWLGGLVCALTAWGGASNILARQAPPS